MSVENVACNRCGAMLEVASGVNFVTCRACGTTLAVRRSGNSAWTEADSADARLDRVEATVGRLDVRDELEALDRQWEREREDYMIVSRYGARHVPDKRIATILGVAVVGGGVLWTLIAGAMTWGMQGMFHDEHLPGGFGFFSYVFSCFPLFGLLFIGIGVGVSMWIYQKAEKYEQARARYEARRAEIEKKLPR